jgi:hypothetical protein
VLIQNKKDLIDDCSLKRYQSSHYLMKFSEKYGFARQYQVSVKNEDLRYVLEDLLDEMIQRKLVSLTASTT